MICSLDGHEDRHIDLCGNPLLQAVGFFWAERLFDDDLDHEALVIHFFLRFWLILLGRYGCQCAALDGEDLGEEKRALLCEELDGLLVCARALVGWVILRGEVLVGDFLFGRTLLLEPRIDEVLDLLAVEFALPLNDDELEVLEPVARVQFVLKGINLFLGQQRAHEIDGEDVALYGVGDNTRRLEVHILADEALDLHVAQILLDHLIGEIDARRRDQDAESRQDDSLPLEL